MTDPIADMLTRIRNTQAVKKKTVIFPYSKIKWEIREINPTRSGQVNRRTAVNLFESIMTLLVTCNLVK